jgi:hypothetical protein
MTSPTRLRQRPTPLTTVAVVTVDATRHGPASFRQAHRRIRAPFSPQSSATASPVPRLLACIITSAPAPPYRRCHGLPLLRPAASPRCYKRGTPLLKLSTHLASPLLSESPSHLAAPHCPPESPNRYLTAALRRRRSPELDAAPGDATATRRFVIVDNVAAHISDDRRSTVKLADPVPPPPVSSSLVGDDDVPRPFDPLLIVRPTLSVPLRWVKSH